MSLNNFPHQQQQLKVIVKMPWLKEMQHLLEECLQYK